MYNADCKLMKLKINHTYFLSPKIAPLLFIKEFTYSQHYIFLILLLIYREKSVLGCSIIKLKTILKIIQAKLFVKKHINGVIN
jgi:hypothetical protein